MNSRYANGVRVERKVVDFLTGLGYISARSAGSKGSFDVYGISETSVRLIQCKSTEVQLVLSAQKRIFTGIAKLYDELYAAKDKSDLARYVTFELWVHEKGKGFTYCFVVGENKENNQYPKGAKILP